MFLLFIQIELNYPLPITVLWCLKLNLQKKVLFLRTDFLPWEVLLIKKLEIEKTKPTFIISVLKVLHLVVLVFSIYNFFSNKNRERNLFVKKKPTTTN